MFFRGFFLFFSRFFEEFVLGESIFSSAPVQAHLTNYFKNCRRIPGESKLEFNSIKRQLYRTRDKQYPKRPATDEEMEKAFATEAIFEEYGRTLDKRRPFYAGSVIKKNCYAFHVFASFGIIDLIKKHIPPSKRKYLVNGTFKIVPRRFRQLLIIAVEYENNVSTDMN